MRFAVRMNPYRIFVVIVLVGAAVYFTGGRSDMRSEGMRLVELVATGTEAEVASVLSDKDTVTLNALRYGRGQGLAHAAVVNAEHPGVIRSLHDAGVDLSIRDDDGRTPLHHAIDADKLAVARLLLDAGASLVAENVAGLSPVAFCRLVLSDMPTHETCNAVVEHAQRHGIGGQ
jgi:hypothetical protein